MGGRPGAAGRSRTSPQDREVVAEYHQQGPPLPSFQLTYEQERWKAIRFSDVKDYQRRDKAA